MKLLQINHRLTTPYHPQVSVQYVPKTCALLYVSVWYYSHVLYCLTIKANGLVERFNQTIQSMLVKFEIIENGGDEERFANMLDANPNPHSPITLNVPTHRIII